MHTDSRSVNRLVRTVVAVLALLLPLLISGCATRPVATASVGLIHTYSRKDEFSLFDALVRTRQDKVNYLITEGHGLLEGTSTRDRVLLGQWSRILEKEWADFARQYNYQQEDVKELDGLAVTALASLKAAYSNLDSARQAPEKRGEYLAAAQANLSKASESWTTMIERRTAIEPAPSPAFSPVAPQRAGLS